MKILPTAPKVCCDPDVDSWNEYLVQYVGECVSKIILIYNTILSTTWQRVSNV